jgi:N utilization substance protein A
MSSIGRRAATRFKSILNQNLKEASGRKACAYFAEKQGEMVLATVVRVTEKFLILNIGMNVESAMPITETLPGEVYESGTTLNVCIIKVEETGKGPRVTVSRAHKDIIKRLFEMYIPEIQNGTVEIIALAREPGSRTKIGIKSNNINVDAKGACVGLNGGRIKQINDALNGERIDIFEWKDDPVQLIAEALTPAKVISVLVNEEEKRSIVIVPDQQFSGSDRLGRLLL